MLRNGSIIPITYVGNAYLTYTSCALKLKYLLFVIQIENSLVSIKKLYKDNNVSMEFFYDCFHMKDLTTKTIILTGALNIDFILYLPLNLHVLFFISPPRFLLLFTIKLSFMEPCCMTCLDMHIFMLSKL